MSFSRSRPNYGSRGRGSRQSYGDRQMTTMSSGDEFRPSQTPSAVGAADAAGSSKDRRNLDPGVSQKSEANSSTRAEGRGGWSSGGATKKYGRSSLKPLQNVRGCDENRPRSSGRKAAVEFVSNDDHRRSGGHGNPRGNRGKGQRRINEDVNRRNRYRNTSSSSARETQDQTDELMALASIYDQPDVFSVAEDSFGGRFCAFVELPQPFFVLLSKSTPSTSTRSTAEAAESSSSSSSSQGQGPSVKFLPPITLLFNLPYDYPSTRQPRFHLICRWLSNDQLSSLCHRLDDIWCEDSGEVVLFKWTVFLKEDALSHLGLTDTLDLSWAASQATGNCGATVNVKSVDKRATLLSEILEFDERRREEVFRSEFFKCNVCLEERVGAKCMQFKGCEHTYCRECMKSYFEVQIGDGNVNRLSCPSDKCASQALPSQVRDLVGLELYAKYDRLLLATTLDSMSDITYCPRDSCQCAVLLESGSALASCPSCCYAFCTFCLMAYHGIEPCKLKFDERLSLYNKYTNGDAEERTRLETRYGRNQLKRLVEATMSDMWLKENSKCCPRCNAQIEKADGCNKMTCSKCNSYFCWLCMQRLDNVNPYRHYDNRSGNGACFGRLFQGVIDNDDDPDNEFLLQEFQAADDEFEGLFSDVSTEEYSDDE